MKHFEIWLYLRLSTRISTKGKAFWENISRSEKALIQPSLSWRCQGRLLVDSW